MFDPAALGTLMIGLDASDTTTDAARRRRARQRTPGAVRIALASILRRAAAALEPTPAAAGTAR